MAISRIKTDGIQDEAVTSAKIGDNIDLDGQFVRVPHGTTAERPSSPAAGYLRFNTTLGTLEQWNTNTNSWAAIDSPPIITSITGATALDPAGGETVTVDGSNFKSGAIVSVNGVNQTTSFVSTTRLTFVTQATAAGDYDVVVTNPNGLTATSTNGASFNGLPAFSSPAAGAIAGDYTAGVAIPTITIVASEPDGGTISYSITSGSLPTGVTLDSAAGTIDGTPTGISATTNFAFTVTATDDESQTSTRNFTLNVLRPVYAYDIPYSSLWRDGNGQWMEQTPPSGASAGRRQWTWSTWVKKSVDETRVQLFSSHNNSTGIQEDVRIDSADQIRWYSHNDDGQSANSDVRTVAKFSQNAKWMHIVVVKDTTLSNAQDRTKIYVNGVQQTLTYTATASSNFEGVMGNGQGSIRLQVGAVMDTSNFRGYMAETHYVSGQSLDPTYFGEDFNGVWIPKEYTGTYGTNGFYLDFADSSNFGNDVSGNNNDLTTITNFATDYRKTDTPTDNYAVLDDQANANGATLYEGMTRAASGGTNRFFALSTVGVSRKDGTSGNRKWYFEVRATSYANGGIAVGHQGSFSHHNPDTDGDLQSAGGWRARLTDGQSYYTVQGGSQSLFSSSTGWTANTWAGVGLDFDNELFEIWYPDGTKAASIDISSRIDFSEYWRPSAGNETGSAAKTLEFNFGGDGTWNLTGGIPTGYRGMNEKDKDEVSVTPLTENQPEKYFNTVLYSGNSGSNSITTGFQPDLVWIKNRTANGNYHNLYDSVRGVNLRIYSNGNNIEEAGHLTSFDSTGFTLNTNNTNVNVSGNDYVAWTWKAGGAPTTDNVAGLSSVPTAGSVKIDGANATSATSGSLSVTRASVNTKSGFSIVEYAGGSSAGTVDHFLGSAPHLILIRSLDTIEDWAVYSQRAMNYAGGDGVQYLNGTNATSTSTSFFSGTHPTSSVFSVNSHGSVNTNGDRHIAYCFTEIPGFSAFGGWYGNGSNNGPFIYTGFKPALVVYKNMAGGEWIVHDNKRQTYNNANSGITRALSWNRDSEENNGTYIGGGSENSIDFIANGFRVRDTNGNMNTDNVNYMWLAWAEEPAKYSTSR